MSPFLMTIDLKTATPEQISVAVAEYVAGYTRGPGVTGPFDGITKPTWIYPGACGPGNTADQLPEYATSADAVLPLLEKAGGFWCDFNGKQFEVQVGTNLARGYGYPWGIAKTLPLAACIALLRAHGVEVVE
jgi:hypothetical protein